MFLLLYNMKSVLAVICSFLFFVFPGSLALSSTGAVFTNKIGMKFMYIQPKRSGNTPAGPVQKRLLPAAVGIKVHNMPDLRIEVVFSPDFGDRISVFGLSK